MESKGKYQFTGCIIRFVMHRGNPECQESYETEFDYQEGPCEDNAEIRTSHIAYILKRDFQLIMVSSVDNYFTFDISENIPMHHSVWYTCNVLDKNKTPLQIFLKITNTHHIGKLIGE